MEGKVIYHGKTKDGLDYVIRYPENGDAKSMCDYINFVSQEKTFIRFQGEQIALDEEVEYLNGLLVKINSKMAVTLLIVADGKVLGNSGIEMKDKTESHEGVFGISIAKNIRGEGIGKKLMELVISEAERNIFQLKLITLGVFGDNNLAFEMYLKFGFIEYGRLPGGSLHQGKYVDHIYMYKRIR